VSPSEVYLDARRGSAMQGGRIGASWLRKEENEVL